MSYKHKNILKSLTLPPGKTLLTNELRNPEALRRRGVSNLKILRRSQGLTLEALSEITGISPSYLSRLECGARRLNTDLMEKLSSVLNCAPSDLLKKTFSSTQGRCEHSDFKALQGREANTQERDLPIYSISTCISTLDDQGSKESANLSSPVEWHARPTPLVNTNAFGLLVSDAGYAPKYNTGDIVYVHPHKPFMPGCTLFIALNDDSVFLRTFCNWNKESIIVRPLGNTDPAANQEILKSTIKSAYKIVGCWDA